MLPWYARPPRAALPCTMSTCPTGRSAPSGSVQGKGGAGSSPPVCSHRRYHILRALPSLQPHFPPSPQQNGGKVGKADGDGIAASTETRQEGGRPKGQLRRQPHMLQRHRTSPQMALASYESHRSPTAVPAIQMGKRVCMHMREPLRKYLWRHLSQTSNSMCMYLFIKTDADIHASTAYTARVILHQR